MGGQTSRGVSKILSSFSLIFYFFSSLFYSFIHISSFVFKFQTFLLSLIHNKVYDAIFSVHWEVLIIDSLKANKDQLGNIHLLFIQPCFRGKHIEQNPPVCWTKSSSLWRTTCTFAGCLLYVLYLRHKNKKMGRKIQISYTDRIEHAGENHIKFLVSG